MDFSFDNTSSSSRPSTAKLKSQNAPDVVPTVDALLSENEFLKQQLEDLKHLYKELHEVAMPQQNSASSRAGSSHHSQQPPSTTEQLLYKELRFEKARRMQVERMMQRLQKANDTRRECLSEIENFALEVKAMAEDAEHEPLNVQYLKKWTNSFLLRIRSFHLQTAKAERQGLFLPGTGYLDESALDLDGLTIMDIAQGRYQDIPFLNTYNIAMLENKLNDLYRYTCKLGNTVKYSLVPSHYSPEEKIVQNAVLDDAQLLCKQIDNVRQELTLLGAVVPSKFDASFSSHSKIDEQRENGEPLSYLSLNTKELLKKLPKFSRYSSECETSLRALAKCFNSQKHIWILEKEMLQEEIAFHDKVAHFFKTYTTRMLHQVDQIQKQMLPTPERPTPSSDVSCLRELYDRFAQFDQDSTEDNLRNLLLCFKTNGDQLRHVIDSSLVMRTNRNLQRDLAKFAREIEVVENEYKLKMDSILGRKYSLEEDLMQREMFMNFKPYMVPLSEEKSNDFYNIKNVPSGGDRQSFQPSSSDAVSVASDTSAGGSQSSGVSSRTKRQSSTRPSHISSGHAAVLDEPAMITTEDHVARATKKSRPPVSKQDKRQTSNLPPNVVELQDIVEESRGKLDEMKNRLETERMTEMQAYALKKQIARQKAALKKSERTLKNMLE